MDLDLQYAALQQTWAQEILAMGSIVFQIAPFTVSQEKFLKSKTPK
jgi:hypothetical protein